MREGRAAEVKTIRETEYRGLHVAEFRADDMRGGGGGTGILTQPRVLTEQTTGLPGEGNKFVTRGRSSGSTRRQGRSKSHR
jgi:hypothetical protein